MLEHMTLCHSYIGHSIDNVILLAEKHTNNTYTYVYICVCI